MKKLISLLTLFVFMFACSSSTPKQTTTPRKELSPGELVFIYQDKKIEGLEKLELYNNIPLLEGKPAPKDGVLYSPRKSAECSAAHAKSERLEVDFKAISKLRITENNLKDNYIYNLEESLKEANKKTWWDENDGWVYTGVGALIGVATSILIFYASVKIKKEGD